MLYPESLQAIKTGRSNLCDWLGKNYPDFKKFLDDRYEGNDYKCKLYMFYNHIETIPTCICGNPVKFHGYTYGFAKWCGPICAQNDAKTREKRENTCMEKYGGNTSLKNNDIIKRGKETKLERYGNSNYNNPEKRADTCLKKYGTSNPQQNPIIRKKTIDTCMEKYGAPSLLSSDKYDRRKKLKQDSYFVGYDNGRYLWKCSNPTCNKCEEKIYESDYFPQYQRIHRYNMEPCPKCVGIGESVMNNKDTNIEKFVKNILNEYNIQYLTNKRPFDKNKELDIYIPDKKLAIECNGCYWHCWPQKPINYHYDKFKMCLDNGVQLLTIWDDQIFSKPGIIRGIILSKLNIYEERIYARKCKLKMVEGKDSRRFLEENHLQGSINGPINIGLYYNGELVSLMVFGKGRKCLNSTIEWELYRYCNKLGTQIIGGASKLFTYFLKTYNPHSIVSFSSNDISIGMLYINLGFKNISNSLSYWYVKNQKRYHRFKFRKSELIRMGFDKNKTEAQIMDELNYYRIYDTGQTKWILTNNTMDEI